MSYTSLWKERTAVRPFPFPNSVPPSDRETVAPYRTPLDWLNFFLADVRAALVPTSAFSC
jgi:hypothetical protein